MDKWKKQWRLCSVWGLLHRQCPMTQEPALYAPNANQECTLRNCATQRQIHVAHNALWIIIATTMSKCHAPPQPSVISTALHTSTVGVLMELLALYGTTQVYCVRHVHLDNFVLGLNINAHVSALSWNKCKQNSWQRDIMIYNDPIKQHFQ